LLTSKYDRVGHSMDVIYYPRKNPAFHNITKTVMPDIYLMIEIVGP